MIGLPHLGGGQFVQWIFHISPSNKTDMDIYSINDEFRRAVEMADLAKMIILLDNRVVKSWIADEKDKRLDHTDERVDRYGWSSMT